MTKMTKNTKIDDEIHQALLNHTPKGRTYNDTIKDWYYHWRDCEYA